MVTGQNSTGTDFRLRIFISYSRKDSELVDRLEADLKARDIYVWVDRSKLEGTSNWIDELQKAIDKCSIMIVVLSPDFLASQFTKMEYQYGFTSGKILLPILYRDIDKVPIIFNNIQWVTKFKSNYDIGLDELLIALGNYYADTSNSQNSPKQNVNSSNWEDLVTPAPAPSPSDRELQDLYALGFSSKARGDLERAELYWGQIVQRNPNFQNGYVKREWEKVQETLNKQRVNNLFQQAYDAYIQGQLSQEVAIWQAILKIDPHNADALLGLQIREQNRNYAWLYEQAREFLNKQDIKSASEQFAQLLKEAPYYDDPYKLAQRFSIGLNEHPVHVKEKRHRWLEQEKRREEWEKKRKDEMERIRQEAERMKREEIAQQKLREEHKQQRKKLIRILGPIAGIFFTFIIGFTSPKDFANQLVLIGALLLPFSILGWVLSAIISDIVSFFS